MFSFFFFWIPAPLEQDRAEHVYAGSCISVKVNTGALILQQTESFKHAT